MAKKIRAYRMTEAMIKRNSLPSYNDLCDVVTQVTPVKIRNIGSWHYHVAEDAKGQVYLIEDDVVMQNKLYERNMGVSETRFMLDGVGKNQIKEFKEKQEESALQVEEEPVKLNEEQSPQGDIESNLAVNEEESPQRDNEIEEEDQGE
jgi:hypothetical protein